MEWEITIHQDNKYLEIVTKGEVDKDGSLEMAKKIAEIMRQHRFTKALIDHRNVTTISGNVIDIYERPRLFRIIGVILGIKLAAIINPVHVKHFKFLETVSVNQGYKYSVFFDRSNALEWLLK